MTELLIEVPAVSSARTGPQSLERALDLLELMAMSDEAQRFTDLHHKLGIPRPVLSRLLKSLVERGYLQRQDDGRAYQRGPAVLRLSRGLHWAPHSRKALAQVAQRVLNQLCEQTGQTAMVVHWNGRHLECVATATAEEGFAPWAVGLRRDQFQRGPWGVVVLKALGLTREQLAQRVAGDEKSMTQAEIEEGMNDLATRGWLVLRRAHCWRYAAAIRAGDGSLIGVAGLFASPAQVAEDGGASWGQAVLTAAEQISWDLGGPNPEQQGEQL